MPIPGLAPIPAYAPLERFIAPARARDDLWRLAATLALAILAFAILTQTLLSLAQSLVGPFWSVALVRALQGGRTPLGVIITLVSFLPLSVGLALAVRILHDRSWRTLFGPARLTWHSLFWVGGAIFLLQVVLTPLQVASPDVGRHLTFARQWPWIVPAVLGILLQTATEEALFRGYLLQQLAVKSRSPLVWMGIPALMFAALHYDPGSDLVDKLWTGGLAFAFSLAAADLTARTGTIGPAIGLHAATNLSGVLLVGLYGRMDGLAAWNLVLNPFDPMAGLPYLAIDALNLLACWLLARLVLRV